MLPVYLTGFGLHTTLGRGLAANIAALDRPPSAPREVEVSLGAERRNIPYYLLEGAPLEDLEARFEHVLHRVIAEALEQAQLSASQRRRMGFFLGSSCGEMPALEAQYRRDLKLSADALPMVQTSSLGNLANRLRTPFGISGPDFSFYTACTASANALLAAASMLRSGQLTHAIVVGVEMFNAVTALGFSGLQLITHDVMRPFDRRRSGLVPGEGCAAIVLSVEPAASIWTLVGGANLCDTHSISATNPDGSAIADVIRTALRTCHVSSDEISALKAHGTASLLNDEGEAAGLRRVFDRALPICALKPYIGHTYGACGAVELALLCGALERGALPATPGIAAESDLGIALTQERTAVVRGKFMLNYFGFGGSNTSVIVANDASSSPLPSGEVARSAGEGMRTECEVLERGAQSRPLTPTLSARERGCVGSDSSPLPSGEVARSAGEGMRTEREVLERGAQSRPLTSTCLYIRSLGEYLEPIDGEPSAADLKALVAEAVGAPVRRIGRFIQLALIGAGRCRSGLALPSDASVYLGSGRGDLEVTIEVMQTLLRDGHAPKPLSFINTVSNAACFYVAQSLKLMGRSSFVCNRYFAFESMLQLAALDFATSDTRTALVGTVDVVVPPLASHRIRVGLAADAAVADATHWLCVQREPSNDVIGRVTTAQHFVDEDALSEWLAAQSLADTAFAAGQFMPPAAAAQWAQRLKLPVFDYRDERAYYDSQSGAVIGEFLRRGRTRTLLHVNRDPSGRYSVMVIERGTAES